MLKEQAQALPPIIPPTCVRWPEQDPLCPYEWIDRLGETFVNLDLAPFPDVGHFPHREDPDRAATEISAFFDRLGWRSTSPTNPARSFLTPTPAHAHQ